jgi:hypothetical protein
VLLQPWLHAAARVRCAAAAVGAAPAAARRQSMDRAAVYDVLDCRATEQLLWAVAGDARAQEQHAVTATGAADAEDTDGVVLPLRSLLLLGDGVAAQLAVTHLGPVRPADMVDGATAEGEMEAFGSGCVGDAWASAAPSASPRVYMVPRQPAMGGETYLPTGVEPVRPRPKPRVQSPAPVADDRAGPAPARAGAKPQKRQRPH